MNRHPSLTSAALAALLCLPAPFGAHAQASAAAVAADPASSPALGAKPGPRLRSPAETADRAAAPGDLRPERRVTPQISIPLGRRPGPIAPASAPARRDAAKPTVGGIDDDAARCESLAGATARAACRDKAAREERARAPR